MDTEAIREQQKLVQWEVVAAGPFEFRLAFRHVGEDRGPTLEVFGRRGEDWREVLRFDAFERRPHWHRCHPEAKDDIFFLEPAGFAAALDFAADQLRDRFGPLLSEQGFSELAVAAAAPEVRAALPTVDRRLRELVQANT
jgi:hypothetical protein